MPERTNGTASKAVEVLRASVGSNPTPSAYGSSRDDALTAIRTRPVVSTAIIATRRDDGRTTAPTSARRWIRCSRRYSRQEDDDRRRRAN